MSDQSKLGLGQIITTEQHRDAVHIAVAPVVAGEKLQPAEHITILASGEAVSRNGVDATVGVVDPFLHRPVRTGERFWLYLYPGSITSLRHEWTHPAFLADGSLPRGDGSLPRGDGSLPRGDGEVARDPEGVSRRWMEKWAMQHMGEDYYGNNVTRELSDAYADAIRAGHDHSVGPYEDARDHIDGEWWSHWETITGQKGDRDTYFSCGC